MKAEVRHYRGLYIYPLVYPHQPAGSARADRRVDGFDAAVRIEEESTVAGNLRCRVFKISRAEPFQSMGDARRASTTYAEQMIDACPHNRTFFD